MVVTFLLPPRHEERRELRGCPERGQRAATEPHDRSAGLPSALKCRGSSGRGGRRAVRTGPPARHAPPALHPASPADRHEPAAGLQPQPPGKRQCLGIVAVPDSDGIAVRGSGIAPRHAVSVQLEAATPAALPTRMQRGFRSRSCPGASRAGTPHNRAPVPRSVRGAGADP